MTYVTPESIRKAILGAAYPAELQLLSSQLRAAGAFSNALAGLIDRLQSDLEFRQNLLRSPDTAFEVGRTHALPGYEVFALVAATALLEPYPPFSGSSAPQQPLAPDASKGGPSPQPLHDASHHRDSARLHLRLLQEREGITVRRFSDDDLQAHHLGAWLETLPSKQRADLVGQLNQMGSLDAIIRRIADSALKRLPPACRAMLESVPVGLVDLPLAHAEARSPSKPEAVVTISRGLMLLLHDMSRVLVAGLRLAPSFSHAEARFLLVHLSRKAFGISMRFLHDLDMKGTLFVELPVELDIEADILRRAMEEFVILHEYGHILQARGYEPITTFARRHPAIGTSSPNHVAELVADAWATATLETTSDTELESLSPDAASYWRAASPYTFLAMLGYCEHIMERSGDIATLLGKSELRQDFGLTEYPSASDRYRHLHQNIRRPSHKSHASLGFCCSVWQLRQILWQMTEAALAHGILRELVRRDDP